MDEVYGTSVHRFNGVILTWKAREFSLSLKCLLNDSLMSQNQKKKVEVSSPFLYLNLYVLYSLSSEGVLEGVSFSTTGTPVDLRVVSDERTGERFGRCRCLRKVLGPQSRRVNIKHYQLKYTVKPTRCQGSIKQFTIRPIKGLPQ